MSEPAQIAVRVWRGDDTPPLVWGFGPADNPADLAGSEFMLTIAWGAHASSPAGEIVAVSEGGGLTVDAVAGTVSWPYTIADSERLPRGVAIRYRLQRLYAGTRQTWVWGALTVAGAF